MIEKFNTNIYAAFVGTSMRYWIKDPERELFVNGKGWTLCDKLSVGDRTIIR